MKRFLQKASTFIDSAHTRLASIIKWASLLMVATTLIVVILRYVFSVGAIAIQELTMYFHGILFLLAIPHGILKDTHVRVDLVYSRLSMERRNLINSIGHCLFLIPVGIFMVLTSLPYVETSWAIRERSSEVGGLPAIFALKACVPIAGTLLTLQGFSELIKKLLKE